MSARTQKALKLAKADTQFNQELLEVSGDRPPGLFSDKQREAIYMSAYFGWYVGRHGGAAWKELLP